MRTTKILMVLLALLCAGKTFGQQDPMYSLYVFNGLVINPAYAGTHETMSASALYRNQWVGVPGAPKTGTLSIDAPFRNQKAGLGLNVVFDKVGIYNRTGVTGMYAYKLKFEKSALSLGLQVGIGFTHTNLSSVNTGSTSADNAFAADSRNAFPDFGFGVYYYTNRFYAGVSIPEVSGRGVLNSISNKTSKGLDQISHYFFNSGYVLEVNKDFKVTPSVLLKVVKGAPLEMDLNCTTWFYDLLALGVSYRSLSSFNFFGQMKVTPQLLMGYAYEQSSTSMSTFNRGSHEVMLQYLFDFSRAKIVTPRYF